MRTARCDSGVWRNRQIRFLRRSIYGDASTGDFVCRYAFEKRLVRGASLFKLRQHYDQSDEEQQQTEKRGAPLPRDRSNGYHGSLDITSELLKRKDPTP
jgi:hypothetical protein